VALGKETNNESVLENFIKEFGDTPQEPRLGHD
jgi:hypothetical protein